MKNFIITTGTEDDFFKRGRRIAKDLDAGRPIAKQTIISFEDPDDMMRLLSSARLNLFKEIKREPGSIARIAERIKRDRSAVKRDIDAMQAAGLVSVTEKTLPGHGRMKEVRAIADKISLQVDVF
jgi:predicted transcriptional regulator